MKKTMRMKAVKGTKMKNCQNKLFKKKKHSSAGDDNLPFPFNVLDDLSQSNKVNNLILHEYKDKTLRCLTIDCT